MSRHVDPAFLLGTKEVRYGASLLAAGGPGALPVQFLGPALSFHHHDTTYQVPLCPCPVATKPCRIPCFDSRHSLRAKSCLSLSVVLLPSSCRLLRTCRRNQSNRLSEERRALPHPFSHSHSRPRRIASVFPCESHEHGKRMEA